VKGVKFETITIDVPNYLLHLLDRFKSQGGIIKRASVQHISQVLDGGFALSKPEALVVCAGLGARNLGGVEDKDVYPIRGQTVVIKAPWIKFGRTQSSLDGLWTYVIPRRSGEVSSRSAAVEVLRGCEC
jgi:glycine/D-amino acid oxidase-like deaminating enzyme